MSISNMLMIVQIIIFLSLVFQISYLVFVYKSIKKMSNSIFLITEIMQKSNEKKINEIKKQQGINNK